jgi:hypothetical protein
VLAVCIVTNSRADVQPAVDAVVILNPLLLYWIGRALMLAHRQAMPDDPIVYTFKDNASRIIIVATMCAVLAAI